MPSKSIFAQERVLEVLNFEIQSPKILALIDLGLKSLHGKSVSITGPKEMGSRNISFNSLEVQRKQNEENPSATENV